MLDNPEIIQNLTAIKTAIERSRSLGYMPAEIGMAGVLAGSFVGHVSRRKAYHATR